MNDTTSTRAAGPSEATTRDAGVAGVGETDTRAIETGVGRAAPTAISGSPEANWSKHVRRIAVGVVPSGAINLNVDGRRLVGPIQGFGRLWQKRYRIRLDGTASTPAEVVAAWKAEFGTFWPRGNRFYGPITSIAPGEVALLNLSMPGRQTLSTGVMVIYADRESFTFMTPEGHMFAAWITFSASFDGDTTVVSIEVLLRANDPVYELMMALGGHRIENEFWMATLRNLASRFGVAAEATFEQTCVDRRRQWRNAKNIRHNAAIRSGIWSMTHPWRAFRRSNAG